MEARHFSVGVSSSSKKSMPIQSPFLAMKILLHVYFLAITFAKIVRAVTRS